MAIISGIAKAGAKIGSASKKAATAVGGKLSKAKTAISESKLGQTVSSMAKNVQQTTKQFLAQSSQMSARMNMTEKAIQEGNRNRVLQQESTQEHISIENRQLDLLEKIERNTRDGLSKGDKQQKQNQGLFSKLFDTLSTIANIRSIASMVKGGAPSAATTAVKGPGLLSRAGTAIKESRIGRAVSSTGSAIKNSRIGRAVSSTGSAIKNSRIGRAVSSTGSAIKNSKAVSAISRIGSSVVGGGSRAIGAAGSTISNAGSAIANSKVGTAVTGAAKTGGGFLSKAFGAVSSFAGKLNPINAIKGPIIKNAPKLLSTVLTKIPGIGALITTALAAYDIASIKSNPTLTPEEKKKQIGSSISSVLGSVIGSVGGGLLVGTMASVVPVLGTTLGGVLGSLGGALVGSYIGGWIGDAIGPEKVYDLAASVPGLGAAIAVEDTATPTEKPSTPTTPTPKTPDAAGDQLKQTAETPVTSDISKAATTAAIAGTVGATGAAMSTGGSTSPEISAPLADTTPISSQAKPAQTKTMSDRLSDMGVLGTIMKYGTPVGMMASAYDFMNPPKQQAEPAVGTTSTPDQKKIETLNINATTVNVTGNVTGTPTAQTPTGTPTAQTPTGTPTAQTPTGTPTAQTPTGTPITTQAAKPEKKKQSLTEQMFGTGTFSKIAPFIPGANVAMMGTKLFDMTSPIREQATTGAQSALQNITQTLSNFIQPKPQDQTSGMSCIPLCDGSATKPSPEWNSSKKNITEMLKEETMMTKIKDKITSAGSSGNTTNIISNNSTSTGGGGGQNYVPNEPRMASAFPDPFFLSVNSELMNVLRC
jgi:hypothetical protein